MSQPSILAYFPSRKRAAPDDIKYKSKVLALDKDGSSSLTPVTDSTEKKLIMQRKNESIKKAVRNLRFDFSPKSARPSQRSRVKSQRELHDESKADIRDSFSKLASNQAEKVVIFQKKGSLTPRKLIPDIVVKEKAPEPPAVKEKNLTEIKQKILRSARLNELRDRIDKFKRNEVAEQMLNMPSEEAKINLKDNQLKIDKIEFEITSPRKVAPSPCKTFTSPIKNIVSVSTASPQRKLLLSPKEVPASPIKASPTKIPAYQRFQADTEPKGLPLPYDYRFLAEAFRSVDTIVGMYFNRKETITYNKLKPGVQELLRRNFNMDHLAKIKTIYPGAFEFRQEKVKGFSSFTQEKSELVLIPMFENSAVKKVEIMGPGIMLERRRIFYKSLLDLVKAQHDDFLLNLDPPLHISKEKIIHWHPEFDLNKCKEIEKAELPKPQNEKIVSAKEVLQQAKTTFDPNSRMEKALQVLANGQASKDKSVRNNSDDVSLNTSIVDTPPATPTTSLVSSTLKGIPTALLEKVRAKQAAKALEAMTRTPNATKEATKYARLPELSKLIRNIFVSEKKSILTIEAVIVKLQDSYQSTLTSKELEELIRLLCKLLPLWASVHNVRKVDYLKLSKDADMLKIIKRLEILADQKL